MRRLALPATLAASFALIACPSAPWPTPKGDGKAQPIVRKPTKPNKGGEPKNTDPTPSAPGATGKVNGVVSFAGTPPAETPIDMKSDKKCIEINKGQATRDHRVKDGKLQDVFLHVTGLPKAKYPIPKEVVVLDQKGCIYEPKMIGIMAKQTLEIINSDPTLHNIHAYGKTEFNNAMPTQGMKLKKKFKKADVLATVKCDVHPWMEASIGVTTHPFYAVTDDAGAFNIDGVPAGTWTLEAVHPKLGKKTAELVVAANGTATVNFEFSK